MVRGAIGMAALSLAAAVPAWAAGGYAASPPASGSSFYSGTSMITADVALAIGWDDAADSASGLAAARVNIPFGNGFNELLEAAGLWSFDGDTDAVGIFSHSYFKNGGWAGGFVLGASSLNGSGVFTAGAEAAAFLPSATLIGQIAYNWADALADFWTFTGEGRFYATPNDKIAGIASYRSGTGYDYGILTALYEHRFDGTMLGLFASVSYLTGPETWRGLVGVHGYFDQPGSSLQSSDYERPFSATVGTW
jgi:hypothetical protein